MNTPQSSSVLQTVNLCKNYTLGSQTIPVLDNINITVCKGEFPAIMGQSGAGKSTLLNILGCLDNPTSGEYYLNQVNTSSMKELKLAEIRGKEIGFIFQNFNLLPKLTVAGNVELPLIYANVPAAERKRRVEEELNRLGLWNRRKHKPNEISGGQKQRVAIARALVKKPSIILADEPTGNLDSHTSMEILDILTKINEEGNTIVMITHEKDVASRAKKIIHLVDGRIV
jgi:putative ABC transport system ATP-binding protein